MDNFTHALIGLVAGEAIYRLQSKTSSKPVFEGQFMPEDIPPGRGAILLTSVIANNLPDLDSLLVSHKESLGYLLYHRGYSHTFVGALAQAFLILFSYFLYKRIRKQEINKISLTWIFITSVAGLLLHIFADSWNSYGVHPFWPFNNKWYYGDFVFILEPWLWLTLCLALMWGTRDLCYRFLGIFILPVIIFLCWITKAVPWVMMMALVVWHLVYTLAFRKVSEKRSFLVACFSFFIAWLPFVGISIYARHEIKEALWQKNPEAKLYDLILSPFPANPLCWNFITVQTEGLPPIYKLQAGIFSLFEKKMGPVFCSHYQFGRKDMRDDFVKSKSDERIIFTDFYKFPLSDFKKIISNCRVAAFMKFARAPYVKQKKDVISVGDFRFGRPSSHGFAALTFSTNESETCPRVPWKEPRSDIFSLE